MPNEIVTAVAKSTVLTEVYRDLLQPSAKRLGSSIEAATRVAVSPIALINWGFEKSEDWLRRKVDARLAATPPEFIIEPSMNIAYEALSRVAVAHDTPELRDLYAELLLKAMDSRTTTKVHPAYFHVIGQLAPKEALVLVGLHSRNAPCLFSEAVSPWSCSSRDREPSVEEQFAEFCTTAISDATAQASIWLTNLCRLGLLSLGSSSEAVFRPEEADKHGVRDAQVDNYEYRYLEFTDFGKAFIDACAPTSTTSDCAPQSA